jgi:dihydroorotate dehydrogenase
MWSALKYPLFALPAETAHHFACNILKHWPQYPKPLHWTQKNQNSNLFQALNPVGLAAGFDKNCEIIESLPAFGFGFAEIGTVTPKPQGGNDLPRLFRDVDQKKLFNRMGFNNFGSGIISERLKKTKPKLPEFFKVGVNLGKNKSTSDAAAADDYAKVAHSFLDTADYFVINVSSPNTPGLRALQSLESLIPIIQAVQGGLNSKKIPIFVKLAPELDPDTLIELIQGIEKQQIDGLVLTNTLAGDYIYRGRTMSGGWSGPLLQEAARSALSTARQHTTLPIISVGGINSIKEAKQRFDLGAQAIQIYTAWIYEGPFFPRTLGHALGSN